MDIKIVFAGLLLIALLGSFYSAATPITETFDGLEPVDNAATTPDCIQQTDLPRIELIKYASTTIFQNDPTTNCGSVTQIDIPSPTGSLDVTYSTIPNATYYSIEVWGLTEAESQVFETWQTPDKDSKRNFQFILGQGYFNPDQTALSTTSSPVIAGFPLATLIDQSNSQFNPKRDIVRCKQKYAWINSTGADAACATNALANSTWNSFTFQKFYAYIKNNSGKKFYLVVENTTNPSDQALWQDSKPIPIFVKPTTTPQVSPNACATVTECLARLDLKFIDQVFKKKNLTDVSSSGEKAEIERLARVYSTQYNVPISVVLATIQQESNYQHTVIKNGVRVLNISTAGAVGAMQVVPTVKAAAEDCRTAGVIQNLADVKKLDENIKCGVYYLSLNHTNFASAGVTRANGKTYFGWQASLAKYVGLGSLHPTYVEEVTQKCQAIGNCPIPA